jgi:uncharacterized protein
MGMLPALGFVVVGALVGGFGTLIGAGGGFLLIPLLLFLYPDERPDVLTAISLAVVFVNALSGTLAYARMRRIDVRSGLVFAAAGIPGAILGAAITSRLDRRVFDPILGGVLILSAIVVLLRPKHAATQASAAETRVIVDSEGTTYRYRPRIGLGASVSTVIGFVSSVLGIGGGILHVPLMIYALSFPVHVATATSHFVLAILALTGVATHAAGGSLSAGLGRVLPLAVGVIVGAPIGARLSTRVRGRWILRGLAVGLAAVGLRLILVR